VTHVVGPSPAFPCNPASASTRGRARHRGGGRPLAARADRRAKRSGLPFALYDEADNRSDPWRLALIAGLRRGRRRRELVLHYQPKPRLAAWIRPLTRYVLEEAVRRARDRQLAGSRSPRRRCSPTAPYLTRPVPADELEARLAAREHDRAA